MFKTVSKFAKKTSRKAYRQSKKHMKALIAFIMKLAKQLKIKFEEVCTMLKLRSLKLATEVA